MPTEPDINISVLDSKSQTSPTSLESIRKRANDLLQEKVGRLNRQFPAYKISSKKLSMGLNSAEITIAIDAPAIWRKVRPTKDELEARLEDYLQKKFGKRVQVSVEAGSIEIAVVFAIYDIAKIIFEIVNTMGTLTEYVVRCIDTGRLEWPPFSGILGVFDLVRSFLGGLFGR